MAGSYTDYDMPPEARADEVFAAIIKEAEKYLGYPYVWGGSSPSTSFDCSGFVSWVINHSGWDVGRLGAQGKGLIKDYSAINNSIASKLNNGILEGSVNKIKTYIHIVLVFLLFQIL